MKVFLIILSFSSMINVQAETTISGELTSVFAIGAETTGMGIKTKDATVEIFVGDEYLRKFIFNLLSVEERKYQVKATGTLKTVQRLERGETKVLHATRMTFEITPPPKKSYSVP